MHALYTTWFFSRTRISHEKGYIYIQHFFAHWNVMLRQYHQQLVETLSKRMNLVLHQKTFPTFGQQSHNQESLFFNNYNKTKYS
jgi:hypothetical protein